MKRIQWIMAGPQQGNAIIYTILLPLMHWNIYNFIQITKAFADIRYKILKP